MISQNNQGYHGISRFLKHLKGHSRPTSCAAVQSAPDQEEMEQAINKFLQPLEKQEKTRKGFKDLATSLSQLLKPALVC